MSSIANIVSNFAAGNIDESQMSGDSNRAPAVTRPHQHLKCPRCDSPNTKFCYYNNYSQSQPRYFCKTCKRYWTKGGALRTVPVGGSCRRRKMTRTSSSARYSWEYASTSPDIGGRGYLNGLSAPMGFHLEGIKVPSNNTTAAALISQLSGTLQAMPPNPCFSLDQLPPPCSSSLFNFNFNFPSGNGGAQEMGNLAPPIEPLSTINQDLQWNLQQEMLGVPSAPLENQIQNPQPIPSQNLEIPTPPAEATFGSSSSNAEATDWLFYDFTFPPPANPTATNTFGNENENGSGNGKGNDDADGWDELIKAWASNVNEFSALP